MRKPRRRCKNPDCREWFHPRFQNEWWCKPECGVVVGIAAREKKRLKERQEAESKRKKEAQQERRHHQIRKLEVKPLSYFKNKAQIQFNTFIRTRDEGKPCISCQRNTGAKMNAGHYRTVKASPETRYDENNCHLQCEHCNSYLSGNIGEYRPNLIEKIGQEAFEVLMGPHPVKKWTREELEQVAAHYRQKTRELIKQREGV